MEDYNLTKDEINILAPRKNIAFEAFRSSVTMCATVFFSEKIIQRLVKPEQYPFLSGKAGVYAMIAGLAGGAVIGAIGAEKYNNKIGKFTKELDEANKAPPDNRHNSR